MKIKAHKVKIFQEKIAIMALQFVSAHNSNTFANLARDHLESRANVTCHTFVYSSMSHHIHATFVVVCGVEVFRAAPVSVQTIKIEFFLFIVSTKNSYLCNAFDAPQCPAKFEQ